MNEPLNEAGVTYCWPRGNDPIPPFGYFAYKYERWRNGRSLGIETVFIQSWHIVDLFKLLDCWTRKGQYEDNPYSFTAVIPVL